MRRRLAFLYRQVLYINKSPYSFHILDHQDLDPSCHAGGNGGQPKLMKLCQSGENSACQSVKLRA